MAALANVTPPAVVAAHAHAAKKARRSWHGYTVRRGDTLTAIALRYGTSVHALVTKNRLHSSGRILAGQRLLVPGSRPHKSKAPAARSSHRRTAAHHATRHHAARKAPVRHLSGYTVRPGDTLSGIALAHHTTVAALMKANHIPYSDYIQAGMRLRVPGPATAPRRHHAVRTPVRHLSGYTVRPGDTLSGIALAHHTTVAALMKANHLRRSDYIQAGSRLRVPGDGPHRATRKARRQHHLSRQQRSFAGRVYPEEIVLSARRTRAYLAGHPVPSRSGTRRLIIQAAHRYGVDPRLALAIGWQESGWNQRAVSVANAIGVMQVLPDSGTWASQLAHRRLNILQAHDNVTAGVVILRYLTGSARNLDEAIAGYYQGLGGVRAHGMYPDTRVYVRSVRAEMTRF